MKKDTLTIALSIVIAGALISVGIILSNAINNPTAQVGSGEADVLTAQNDESVENNSFPDEALKDNGAPVLGNKDAPVTLVEFADFQCPFCARFFATAEKQIIKEYVDTGKARLIFKPLHFIDYFDGYKEPNESYLAALAGECANEQDRFWDMHEAIYEAEINESSLGGNPENSGNLNRDFFIKTAVDIGMNVDKFTKCLDTEKYKDKLNTYAKDAEKLMLNGVSTPTLFVNGTKISGLRDFSYYKNIIDSFLK